MTRRLTLAIVGVVVATLVLAGLGTLVLGRFASRSAAERDLGDAAEAISAILASSTENPRSLPSPALQQIRRALSVQGAGFVAVDADGQLLVSDLPPGVTLDDLDPERLLAGETITGRSGSIVYAAAPVRTPAGGLAIVLTNEPEPIDGAVLRWFLISAAATLVLAILVARILGRRITAPVRDARDATRRIAAGDLSARVLPEHTRADDELADLARSIDEMAEALERSRGLERQFLLSVSHDLRTPMTSIQGYAEGLADGAITDASWAGGVILGEARRLDRLVRDLLDLARLDSRRFTLNPADDDLAEIVAEVTDGFAPALAERGVALAFERPDAPSLARIDRDRAGQIVANLVENASRYARSAIAIEVESDDRWVTLTVADDGPGIDAADLPHVFERLYVARHGGEARESGSGLGLAIVRELVDAMGGEVAVRSTPGDGSAFVVRLPAA